MTARLLTLGIGSRRGVTVRQVELAVGVALGARSLAEVRQVTTIDCKTAEPALVEFCHRHALPLRGIAREAITSVVHRLIGSEAARRHLGVHGVSEPCALLGARDGVLITGKTVHDGVTVAVAIDSVDVAPDTTEGVE